ncbi:hypothetical protein ACHQM5_007021 [Ranunculus cassubicifolius]
MTTTTPKLHDLEQVLASVGLSSYDDDAPSFIEDVFGPKYLCKCEMGCRHPIPKTKKDAEALSLTMGMPGLKKENVILTVTGNLLVVFGREGFIFKESAMNDEGFKKGKNNAEMRSYCAKFVLSDNYYKLLHMIMAEMKNEVLKIVVPKYKEKEEKVMVL